MILVDSSVWVDSFNGRPTPQTDWLDEALGRTDILMGDLILAEVLQGFASDKEFATAQDLLMGFPCVILGGRDVALASAAHLRRLRRKGVTVRR